MTNQENKKPTHVQKNKRQNIVFYTLVSLLLLIFLALLVFGIVAIVDFNNYKNTTEDGLIWSAASRENGFLSIFSK
ncbi:hypothetical protein [Mycoplasma sp. Ms02]|uniref:hypothetical protein n=1 Tax=Mycoplasma sp. Ms02 TaxID=353851 RepID=UPI001C8A9482|nr:hypothetical protein [Mycoplasma sp. Ms02]QZE12674.1 hypothetical protein K4L35_01675 [Mycoplasma sp. Ms02]